MGGALTFRFALLTLKENVKATGRKRAHVTRVT